MRMRLARLAAVGVMMAPIASELWAQPAPTIIPGRGLRVIRVRFQPTAACSGVDDSVTPVAAMVPIGGAQSVQATIAPAAQATRVQFLSVNTGVATVSPASAGGTPQAVQLGGVAHGVTAIRANTTTSGILRELSAYAKNRVNRTIAIHAITEQNDDAQIIPVGRGESNQTCVSAGLNGVFNSAPGGDDAVIGTTEIGTGSNGICETTASGDDVQVISVGRGRPNRVCVARGANAFRDSVQVGDDQVVGDDIDSGADGICQAAANATNVAPSGTVVPTAAALQTYLNTIWGLQANVFFTVTRTDPPPINFDLDRSGTLAHPSRGSAPNPAEGEAISAAASDSAADFNIYYVLARDFSIGTTAGAETWTAANGANSPLNHTAHEVGHLLGITYESNDAIDIMLSFGSASNPCNVKRVDWETVNP